MITNLLWTLYNHIVWIVLATLVIGIISFFIWLFAGEPRCPIHGKRLEWDGYSHLECPEEGCKYREHE